MIRRAGVRHIRAPEVRGLPGPIWPPTKLPGCVGWLDMLETYTESGGTVTAIRNMVSGSDAMSEATNPPALSSINGRSAIKGDGSNDRLFSTEAALVAALSGAEKSATVIMVYQSGAQSTAFRACWSWGNSTVETSRVATLFLAPNMPCQFTAQRRDDAALQPNRFRPGQERAQLPSVVTVAFDVGRVEIECNLRDPYARRDVSPGWFSSGQLTPNRVGIFCRADLTPDLFDDGRMGAMVVYDRYVPIIEREGVVAAMMGLWGITG